MGFPSFLIFLFLLSAATTCSSQQNFVDCLINYSNGSTSITHDLLHAQYNSSFTSILDFSSQNLLFTSSSLPKPNYIFTPLHESQIQAAVICSKQHGLLIRTRSGGHDYEGSSYVGYKYPFIIIDLVKFDKVDVNIEENTTWVQAGATVGQVNYWVSQKSNTLAFPGGIVLGVGVGGLITGGGQGLLLRKYGLSADNVLDATIVDVNGRTLDRNSMGENLFWAIRGGGGASYGVVLSWKVRLVPVPSTVTVYNAARTLEQGGSNLFYKWQNIAPKISNDFLLRAFAGPMTADGKKTISVRFQAVFLGNVNELVTLMEKSFPELGLTAKDCVEMSWVNSTLSLVGLYGQPLTVLLDRTLASKMYFKGKSDFVQEAIPITDLESIWKVMLEDETAPSLVGEPFGGIMDKISESAIPFPHRKGKLYNLQYWTTWLDGNKTQSYVESIRRLHDYMTPYVSKSPRGAYFNYRDFHLGVNKDITTSYSEASVWGEMYFKSNFERLAYVKSIVDPDNYFWHEQSIPPFSLSDRINCPL